MLDFDNIYIFPPHSLSMSFELIPGRYQEGNEGSPVAVATLSNDKLSLNMDKVAICGPVMTENIGITKIVINLLRNPVVRYLVLCGKDALGHRPGDALLSLHKNGYNVDESGTITIKDTVAEDTRLPINEDDVGDAYERFKGQIHLIDLIGEVNPEIINGTIENCFNSNPGPYGDAYNLELKKPGDSIINMDDTIVIHRKIRMGYFSIHGR